MIGVTVKVQFKGFPPTSNEDERYIICTDEQRLQQVLMNLLSNALKFTPSDGQITIECELRRPKRSGPQFIQISVQDTGIGISEEDQKNLFRLFGFLDASKDLNTKGIGLGLHICKMIATFMGGEIGCKSKLEQGAKFTYSFKLEPPSNQQKKGIVRIKNPNLKNYPKITKSNGDLKTQKPQRTGRFSINQMGHDALMIYSQHHRNSSPANVNEFSRRISQISNSRRSTISKLIKQKQPQRRVLVADDEPFNISALKILLQQSGHKNLIYLTDFVQNGAQAIEAAKQGLSSHLEEED